MTGSQIVQKAKAEANSPKDKLISILHELEEYGTSGAIREAKKLEAIIIKLEIWQNS